MSLGLLSALVRGQLTAEPTQARTGYCGFGLERLLLSGWYTQRSMKIFLCKSRRDMKDKRTKDEVKRCRIVRGGCEARMVIKFDRERALWVVTIFDHKHNHPLIKMPWPH